MAKVFSRNRMLFVDDEPSIRLTLPTILREKGFDVRVAATVEEAMAEIQTHKFDVLLSDLNIKDEGDGFTVVTAMRRVHPLCVTIILTGYPALESAVEAVRQQLDDYLVKPADVDYLLTTIEKKLATRGTSAASL